MSKLIKILLGILFSLSINAQTFITSDNQNGILYGVYEVKFNLTEKIENPYKEVELKVEFKKPNGRTVIVDGYYDGDNVYKARAYCSEIGTWVYETESNYDELNDVEGEFIVVVGEKDSKLKGKLKISPDDPRQMVYDNGDWFLHIGDTGYRYVVDTEPMWKEYIDQAVEMGATKIRTWFCRDRHSVDALFANAREELDLSYWQMIEKRIIYALNKYPNVIIQLIPYGEGTEEIKRYNNNDYISKYVGKYAQARWSSFPNIHWCITNDRIIIVDENSVELKKDKDNRCVPYDMINKMGHDFKNREPWGTLITNHQSRFKGYDFIDESWSDIITLEELDGVDGKRILEFRNKGTQPVINDEDRYELYRNAGNRRYFFRRLMWASLLSGGAATYGGANTWAPYKQGTPNGVQGYYSLNKKGILFQGAHDFNNIHKFFNDSELTLINMQPNDSIVGNNPFNWKCSHDDKNYIIYLANPNGDDPQKDNHAYWRPKVNIQLPEGNYSVSWFDPTLGTWDNSGKDIVGGLQELTIPPETRAAWGSKNSAWGDRVLLIRRGK